MTIVLKVLKWTGIALLAIAVLVAALLIALSLRPFAPSNYTKTVETGGALEARYMAMGEHAVACLKEEAPGDWEQYVAWYPQDVEGASPVVIMVNGTGVPASKYQAVFEHLASWGFVVAGNADPSTCLGDSADATLDWLLSEASDPASTLYGRVDAGRVGIVGHSQGGVGAFNAVSNQPNGEMYSCAVSLSPTGLELADAIGLHYEPQLMIVPTLLLAADANDVITPEGMQDVYQAIRAPKVMALRSGANHGEMLYTADGYVTAWLLWWLAGDGEAAGAFVGNDAELLGNPLYAEQAVDIAAEPSNGSELNRTN